MADATEIVMPKLGLTMTEGVIAAWNVAVGADVHAGDVLFTVETDKIATDIEARGDGKILSILLSEGASARVGQAIATWSGPASQDSVDVERPAAEDRSITSPLPSAGRIKASPVARRLASQQGVDLTRLIGSGPRGRIVASDVKKFAAEAAVMQGSASMPPAETDQMPSNRGTATGRSERAATLREKTAARRLAASKQSIPHFYIVASADISKLLELRRQLNADKGAPARISLNHFILACVARALVRTPELNAVWEDDRIVTFSRVDVGMAVDTDKGLVVPVLRDAAQLGIDSLAAAANTLVAKAREARLVATDLSGGAVTVSNVGMCGAAMLIPIINPGQSAILGVGAPSPVFRPDSDGNPVLRQELNLTLSCDHRIWDGVRGAKYLDAVRTLLEHPLAVLRG